MRTLICLSITILLLSSCGKEPTATDIIEVNGHEVYVTHADQITDTVDIMLSDMLEYCEVIPLETKEEAFISRAHKIAVSDNYIAIKDSERTPLKLFTRDGKYLREIGAVGRGPDEYNISLYGVQIDEARDQLYLLPFANARQILVFGTDGQAREHIPLRFQQRKFKAWVEDDIVTVLGMPFKQDSAVVYQQTIDGELIQYIPPEEYHIALEFSSEIGSTHNTGAYDFFQAIYSKTQDDTLYHYDVETNNLIPRYTVDFETEEWPLYVCYDLPGHYYAWISGRGIVLADKKTTETHYVRFINDFYGGIEVSMHWDTANGMFISSMPALDLMKEIDRCLEEELDEDARKKLEALDSSIDENSNDILFVGKFLKK
ncbi:MAG: 6-bladed beta-propeller [Bacteroidales bacterium]|nr:6-bladed beta-propeller [Bacteroidales bacterium]